MIDYIIRLIRQCFPLQVKWVSWDGNILTLSGSDWRFSTISAWRVLGNASIEYACWDEAVENRIKEFEGEKIIGVDKQGAIVPVDPVFKLSTGKQLEIFSSDTFEPWVLKLPDGQVFAGALEMGESSLSVVKSAA
jgi:hypothetical protein